MKKFKIEEIENKWQNNKEQIVVSIFCPTFNHENTISVAIESFISQETNFPFEIIIVDDKSNDKTVSLIKQYQEKYPNIIKTIFQKENKYSKNENLFRNYFLMNAKGKYLAICDGDDYWCDSFKLQKQVDFLEANLEFSGCTHNTKVLRENMNANKEEFIVNNNQKDIFTINDYVRGEIYFHTSSVLYRLGNNKEKILELLSFYRGDWFLSMVFASFGPIKYLDEVMSVYRIHDKGVWSELSAQEQVMKNLDAILKINKAFDYAYEENFMQLFARVFITSKIDKSIANLSKLFDSLSKEELVKIIFYIEQYTKKQEEHIAYEKELWQQREDHIQKIQSSFGWKVGSLIDKLRG